MVGALHRRETAGIALNTERADAEHRRAAWNYLIWPMAVYEMLAVRETKSNWFQFHTRQALWFGLIAGAAAFVALAWPLVVTAIVAGAAPVAGGTITATIWIYVLAFLADIAVFAVVLTLALRYSRRAARGEMFEIPLIAAITRRVGVKRQSR